MGLPWIQIASEVIDHGAADLALMLDWDEAGAGWGMVKGFDWALKRADPKKPPSWSSIIRGPHAALLVARAFGWNRDADLFVTACEHLPKPPLERLEDGSIQLHGLDRYDRAWKKNNQDLWKTLQAESGANTNQNSDGTAPETGTKPAPVRAGTPPQDRDRDQESFFPSEEPPKPPRKLSPQQQFYAWLEECRLETLKARGVVCSPEAWAIERQNTQLKFVKNKPPEVLQEAFAIFLEDERRAGLDPPWAIGSFVKHFAEYESKAVRQAAAS